MLTGNAEPLNWGVGLLIALGIVGLLRPAPSPINWSHLPQAAWATLKFLSLLLWDLLASGVQVARLVLQPQPNIQQGILAIPDATDKGWITTISAEAITLTPGELVVEIGEDGTLYTHTLNVQKSLTASLHAQEDRAQQLEEIAS